jgi:hypothetical protein
MMQQGGGTEPSLVDTTHWGTSIANPRTQPHSPSGVSIAGGSSGGGSTAGCGDPCGNSAVVQYPSWETHCVPSHTHGSPIHTHPGYAGDTHQRPGYAIHELPPQSQKPVPQ